MAQILLFPVIPDTLDDAMIRVLGEAHTITSEYFGVLFGFYVEDNLNDNYCMLWVGVVE